MSQRAMLLRLRKQKAIGSDGGEFAWQRLFGRWYGRWSCYGVLRIGGWDFWHHEVGETSLREPRITTSVIASKLLPVAGPGKAFGAARPGRYVIADRSKHPRKRPDREDGFPIPLRGLDSSFNLRSGSPSSLIAVKQRQARPRSSFLAITRAESGNRVNLGLFVATGLRPW